MRATLLDLFPTPRYLAPPILGLDISDGSVKYVELVRHGGGVELGRYGERALPPGALLNGKIQKPDEVREVLSGIHAELGLRAVAVCLMEEQGYLLRIRVSVQTEAEIREGIELQLEEHIPLSPAEALFDYEIISQPHGDVDSYEVSVCVFPRELVAAYLALLGNAGFEVVGIEIESQSIARSVVPQASHGTCMVVDFGKYRTGIAITSDGVVSFSSSIPIGGENFTRVLEKELNLPAEKAEELKKEKGVARSNDSSNLFSFFVPVLSVLKEEVGKRYAYWHTHPYESGAERQKIESVILCGRGANMRGLAEYLSSGLGMPVVLANPWCNTFSFTQVLPRMPLAESLGYAGSIGLALRAFDSHGVHTISL